MLARVRRPFRPGTSVPTLPDAGNSRAARVRAPPPAVIRHRPSPNQTSAHARGRRHSLRGPDTGSGVPPLCGGRSRATLVWQSGRRLTEGHVPRTAAGQRSDRPRCSAGGPDEARSKGVLIAARYFFFRAASWTSGFPPEVNLSGRITPMCFSCRPSGVLRVLPRVVRLRPRQRIYPSDRIRPSGPCRCTSRSRGSPPPPRGLRRCFVTAVPDHRRQTTRCLRGPVAWPLSQRRRTTPLPVPPASARRAFFAAAPWVYPGTNPGALPLPAVGGREVSTQ